VPATEIEKRSAAGQIVRHDAGLQARVRNEGRVGGGAGVGINDPRKEHRAPICVQANRIESGIGDAELEILDQARLLDLCPDLQVVAAASIGNVRFDSIVGQKPIL